MSKLELKRRFSQEPGMVFDFVTRKEHLVKWWGPEGVNVPDHALDFSRIGAWYSVMVNAEGKRFKVSGEVTAVDAPRCVEFTWAWHDVDDVRGHESIVRLEVNGTPDGGSELTIHHSQLADDESAANHDIRWTSSLKKLERMAN